MIDYSKRSLQKELLDGDGIPFSDIALNMTELSWINGHLGGHAITIEGFRRLSSGHAPVSVCEIGCGGGDNLNRLSKYCRIKGINASFTGIDVNKECIAFAKARPESGSIQFIVSDYRHVDFGGKHPDILFSSLFCHHFSDEELVDMLKWMRRYSTCGFFINDLHRHPIAYHSIKAATALFSKSYLVKNDAPVSVLRGFKRKEWEKIFLKAEIPNYSIGWKWAFRHLIIAYNN